jgi:hypothetical protein
MNAQCRTSRVPGVALAIVAALALGVGFGGCSDQPSKPVPPGEARSTSATPTSTRLDYALPSVGADGFPRSVYPVPGPGGGGSIPACPSAAGLSPFTGTAPARAAVVWATTFARSFSYDLHHTDRAWWPTIRRTWRGSQRHDAPLAGEAPVGPDLLLYAGPLRTTPQFGVPRQYGFLKHYCGANVADASYALVSGPRHGPALQGVAVFLNRRNHVLLYYEYP